jgi:hypothetical protein
MKKIYRNTAKVLILLIAAADESEVKTSVTNRIGYVYLRTLKPTLTYHLDGLNLRLLGIGDTERPQPHAGMAKFLPR